MKIFVDGSPTAVCFTTEEGPPVVRGLSTSVTSNQAEYLAVIFALNELPGIDEILSDSELVIKQLNGEDIVRNEELKGLACEIWRIVGAEYAKVKGGLRCTRTGNVKFTWVPREENKAGEILG